MAIRNPTLQERVVYTKKYNQLEWYRVKLAPLDFPEVLFDITINRYFHKSSLFFGINN